jgi:hypothetical protein
MRKEKETVAEPEKQEDSAVLQEYKKEKEEFEAKKQQLPKKGL